MTETYSQTVGNPEDFKEEYSKLLIFTYGTLMKGECNHIRYLQDAAYLGRAYLEDHALYNIGWYPGAVEQKGSRVYGEVYSVDIRKMPELDCLESEGSLYHRKPVTVIRNGVKTNVQTYIYARGTENCEPIPSGDWHETQKDSPSQLIWYLAYGSNILEDRFLKYIEGGTYQNKDYQGCNDKSRPLDKRPFRVPYQVYFARKSGRWNNKGVAFLDPCDKISEGLPGRIYLITLEQFSDIQKQEGTGWYSEVVDLGKFEGIPVKTFTSRDKKDLNEPDPEYLDVIRKGIQEAWPRMSGEETEKHLKRMLEKSFT